MNLPPSPRDYGSADQDQMRGELLREDKRNIKRGDIFDKILMRDTATGVVKAIVMTNGALVIT